LGGKLEGFRLGALWLSLFQNISIAALEIGTIWAKRGHKNFAIKFFNKICNKFAIKPHDLSSWLVFGSDRRAPQATVAFSPSSGLLFQSLATNTKNIPGISRICPVACPSSLIQQMVLPCGGGIKLPRANINLI
jgi:hypothetical protein